MSDIVGRISRGHLQSARKNRGRALIDQNLGQKHKGSHVNVLWFLPQPKREKETRMQNTKNQSWKKVQPKE